MLVPFDALAALPDELSFVQAAPLAFSVLEDVRAMIAVVPLVDAQHAYDKMLSGAARFRMVLTID